MRLLRANRGVGTDVILRPCMETCLPVICSAFVNDPFLRVETGHSDVLVLKSQHEEALECADRLYDFITNYFLPYLFILTTEARQRIKLPDDLWHEITMAPAITMERSAIDDIDDDEEALFCGKPLSAEEWVKCIASDFAYEVIRGHRYVRDASVLLRPYDAAAVVESTRMKNTSFCDYAPFVSLHQLCSVVAPLTGLTYRHLSLIERCERSYKEPGDVLQQWKQKDFPSRFYSPRLLATIILYFEKAAIRYHADSREDADLCNYKFVHTSYVLTLLERAVKDAVQCCCSSGGDGGSPSPDDPARNRSDLEHRLEIARQVLEAAAEKKEK